ncbi:uncharacterized protein BDZ83DRAFT_69015 [Colletotrichum acutatum]|uniref:Uncharacterized protein n=1 Tax=Glomerella acutata TaxID=27357 RepID=A0AAD8XKP1_GLOAC|nr:uncharacterized protein BDZ83DRAFT_69015 [Colletotrichum acutatum]KAK1729140.1 hypothetical protein BDZ83DRAFT_69015 [Colletotrichum acutatum]
MERGLMRQPANSRNSKHGTEGRRKKQIYRKDLPIEIPGVHGPARSRETPCNDTFCRTRTKRDNALCCATRTGSDCSGHTIGGLVRRLGR